ncbi:IS4 family transposase [Streptacidiphilus sp. PAMC 29251]
MRLQSAITTFTRSITVAAGVFAPGHLGELTRYLPFELVDAVLEETGTVQRRLRCLPSRAGVYFLFALALFPQLGYAGVWGKLVAGLSGLPLPAPSETALRHLRRRLGAAPMKALFEVVAGPLAQPHTPGVRYRHYRTVAFDGCSSIKVPDSERNRGWLGKVKYRLAWAGYPTVMLMALVETGTRGLLGATFGPSAGPDTGERAYATRLLPLLNRDMLLLADRGFDGNDFLTAAAKTGARLLVRARSTRRPPMLTPLPDGSFLSRIAGLRVRIIDADIVLTIADGTVHTNRYRLVTTLLDHRTDPAGQLIRLYHERWEVESAFYSLRHTMLTGHILRSGDQFGIEQELWAQLTVYQVLRTAMVAAAESRPGTDPDRTGFTTALESAREELTLARGIVETGEVDLVGAIGRAVLANLLDERRPRFNARKVKSPVSRYHARPKADDRPLTSIDITQISVLVHAGTSTPPPACAADADPIANDAAKEVEPPRILPAHSQGTPPQGSRKERVLALLLTDPQRAWRGREVAHALGVTNLNSFCVQLSQWAHRGLLNKTGPATYTLAA